MHRDVTLVAKKSSNKLTYLTLEERKLKTAKKLLYSIKRSFQLGNKKFRVIYTLSTQTCKFVSQICTLSTQTCTLCSTIASNIFALTFSPHSLSTLVNLVLYAGPLREGGGQGRGQLAPGPKQVGPPSNLRNILKLNKMPSKSGEYKALTAAFKGIKGPVWRYSQRFGVLSTGF